MKLTIARLFIIVNSRASYFSLCFNLRQTAGAIKAREGWRKVRWMGEFLALWRVIVCCEAAIFRGKPVHLRAQNPRPKPGKILLSRRLFNSLIWLVEPVAQVIEAVKCGYKHLAKDKNIQRKEDNPKCLGALSKEV